MKEKHKKKHLVADGGKRIRRLNEMSGKAIRKGKNRRKVRRDFGPYTIQSSTSKDARSNNFPTHPSCHSFSSWWREREREAASCRDIKLQISSFSYRRGAAGTGWAISSTAGRKTGRGGHQSCPLGPLFGRRTNIFFRAKE